VVAPLVVVVLAFALGVVVDVTLATVLVFFVSVFGVVVF